MARWSAFFPAPGAGGSIAGLVAYSEARRVSRNSAGFGKGEPEGVQATESANNATVGGGFIPTLVLGIPGTPPDAVILGALLIQGVRTGPQLFTDQGSIVYTFIWGLLIATLLMLPIGLLVGRYAYRTIVTIPKAVLVPSVAFMTVIGTYSIRNSVSDVIIMITLGVMGWILGRFGFSASPIVLGLILGPIAEQGFVQAWTIGSAMGNLPGMFFGRPISLGIIAFTLLSLFWPLFKKRLATPVTGAGDDSGSLGEGIDHQPLIHLRARGTNRSNWLYPWRDEVVVVTPAGLVRRRDTGGGIVALVLLAVGALVYWDTLGYGDVDSQAFPRAVSLALMVISAAIAVRSFWPGRHPDDSLHPARGSWPRRLLLSCW